MLEATFATTSHDLDTEPLREPTAFDALVREIGEDGAREVRAVFWSDTSARLKLFRTLAPAAHRARIEREAHSLKSTARSFGYLRLAALALALERSAAALSDDGFGDLIAQMDLAYAAALAQEQPG
ncbi:MULTISPECIES: Hpt domain-containing protein [unclassified Bradyrhizobium]|uniref:Hpt domain-containing protein n=1 Tax=unclassified Bradyrhizobium TaxID=2631580 RepID=UPI00247ACD66|nr:MULTISPECIES: Hpt domain-containing protein [unclassified Bradyrhizobium]WGR71787.1 Hpt domain-containing protein [Bradyrhizobium sp. ISRA426]WGR76622.1 Hpt domain-containing protein [Bradyrhizobium sp. ISRA430]WGR87027.1 Hpt domain-containing protein [Bradyrhizobium sp. ISRA432]